MKRSLLALVVALPLVCGACSSTSADNTPYPEDYVGHAIGSKKNRIKNIVSTANYVLLNTNTSHPPYDTYSGQLGRDMATIHKSMDAWLFENDWEDPYVD